MSKLLNVVIDCIGWAMVPIILIALASLFLSSCSSSYERTNPIPRICKELGKECR